MRKLILHALAFLAINALYQALQDARFDTHATRMETTFDLEGHADAGDLFAALDNIAGGES